MGLEVGLVNVVVLAYDYGGFVLARILVLWPAKCVAVIIQKIPISPRA